MASFSKKQEPRLSVTYLEAGLAIGAAGLVSTLSFTSPAAAMTPMDSFETFSAEASLTTELSRTNIPDVGQLLVLPSELPLNAQSRAQRLQELQAGILPRPQSEPQASLPIAERFPHSAPASNGEDMPLPARSNSNPLPSFPEDGVYLYGQVPVANQLATTYLVFEARSGTVTGAFYMPSSSYDCVQGTIGSSQIDLSVTDSYLQDSYRYALGLEYSPEAVASQVMPSASSPSIAGFYALPVTTQDLALVATCQALYQ